MADVLIAGGGVAGASLAIMLGRKGLTVELFEKRKFPKEKPCGEGLMPAGVRVLDELGLTAAIAGVPFYGVQYHFRGQVIQLKFPAVNGSPSMGIGQRRWHLDQVLFNTAAATSGVTAYTEARVDAPVCENGRVVGLLVRGEKIYTPLVVVADGLHSRLRRLLGLHKEPPQPTRFGIRTHFRLAYGQTQPPWVEVFIGRGYELYVAPLPKQQILIAGLAKLQDITDTAGKMFERWISLQPELASRLEGAEQLTSLLGMSPLSGAAISGVTPGAVLLGDAASCLDPITGAGMAQALITAKLLATYLSDGIPSEDSWLWRFERERKTVLRDYRILTRMVLWLANHERIAPFFLRLLRASPTLSTHLVGVSGGVRTLL